MAVRCFVLGGKRSVKNLDVALSLSVPQEFSRIANTIQVPCLKKSSKEKGDLVLLKKKIWLENFCKDYPSYASYASLCTAWRVSMIDVDALKKRFGEIDKKLEDYILLLRKRAIPCPKSLSL